MQSEDLTGELAFAESVSSSATAQDAAAALFAYATANGFSWAAYFPFYASGESPASLILPSPGAPTNFFEAFLHQEFSRFGPVKWTKSPVTSPILMSDLAALAEFSETQTGAATRLRQLVGLDAVIAPAFGPAGRNGVVLFAFGDRARKTSPTDLLRFGWIAQTTHARILSLNFPHRFRAPDLTAREYDVYRCIVRGMSNIEIAETLTLSPNTVDTHIRRLFAKLGVNDRIAAIRQAVVNGLFYQLGGDTSDRIGRLQPR
jgi:LuxR family transcriptional regulator/LuxR family quorum-sensing system transcriptional regulator CciR